MGKQNTGRFTEQRPSAPSSLLTIVERGDRLLKECALAIHLLAHLSPALRADAAAIEAQADRLYDCPLWPCAALAQLKRDAVLVPREVLP